MGKEFYFETDDGLDRKKYAEFLKTLLEHCDEYRREDSDGAYVIAIDSPWGTGKTRFAKMLRNFLENRTSKTPIKAPVDPSKGFLTVYYNAWDTDFSNDALEPLIYSLINSPELESELFEKQADEEIDNFIDSAKKVLKVIGLSAAHHFLGETVAKVLNDCNDEKDNNIDEVCDYEKRRNAIEDFRETLSLVIERTRNKKLVIIVDELDRCRPNYAIQTLEIAKHLFSVRGLVFIFALDIKQLSCSVRKIYGQEMDSAGYLCRFFDYIGILPNNQDEIFSSYFFKNYSDQFSLMHNNSYRVEKFIPRLMEIFKVSLREFTTILMVYKIMLSVFLKHYYHTFAHPFYLFLLVMKFKNIDLFKKIFQGDKMPEELMNYITEFEPKLQIILTNQFSNLVIKDRICDLCLPFISEDDNQEDSDPAFIDYTEIKQDTSNLIIRYKYDIRGHTLESKYSSKDSWGYLLFEQDLAKWESIKFLSLRQYYNQQLEMFNFALPSDEPAKPE